MTTPPLSNLRVVDLSRLVAGNIVTHKLADFGADVIKVEKPGRGDDLRHWRVEGVETFWKAYSRNKRSLALDSRKDDGMEILKRLIDTADVLVENFRPGTLEAMGLGPDNSAPNQPRPDHPAYLRLGPGRRLQGPPRFRIAGRSHVGFRGNERL